MRLYRMIIFLIDQKILLSLQFFRRSLAFNSTRVHAKWLAEAQGVVCVLCVGGGGGIFIILLKLYIQFSKIPLYTKVVCLIIETNAFVPVIMEFRMTPF